jgi:2-polyprenyl-3-methyl-5-hydroxy-6-metoxy-1,4-benzoquinol methylase
MTAVSAAPAVQCPACTVPGRATTLTLAVPDGRVATLLRCPSCGTEFWSAGPRMGTAGAAEGSEPDSDASEYWEQYKFELYADVAVREAYEERYARMLALLIDLGLRPESLLDMGGGIGNFALWGAERNLRAIMTDVDAGAVAEARARGVEAVLPGELAGLLPENGVDLVTLWDVIEHSSEPIGLLQQARAALAPGGALFLETPDARFPLRKGMLGLHRATGGRVDRTGALYYWEHKVYFTQRGLSRLLQRCGMHTVAVERWTSPRAKMTQLLANPDALGTSALYRGVGRAYPYADQLLERVALGNKLIVVAVPNS